MPEMTPLEAAKRIEEHNRIHSRKEPHAVYIMQALNLAASLLRKIASGEYAPVVHAKWIDNGRGHYCSNCSGYITNSQWAVYKNPHCPYCGSLMDEPATGQTRNGKDDSHETD
jgi:hypothetical protein